jgi:hypothetical protein
LWTERFSFKVRHKAYARPLAVILKNAHSMKKKQIEKTCYMCENTATSREHVPPICLFPEEKDIKTTIFRNNLITVPSCDIHNSKKSKDDEFLMACLAGIVGNNVIGYFHTHTKVRRALQRKDLDFLESIIKNPKEHQFEISQGQKIPVLIGQPDIGRLTNCFEHIAHGLYFNKFNKKFKGEIHSILDFVTYEDEKTEKFKILVRTRIEFEKSKRNIEGTNKEIFKYEFFEPDEFGLIGLQMQFYEGAKVFIAFQEEGIERPRNLAIELINRGIKTIVKFDDKTSIEFN